MKAIWATFGNLFVHAGEGIGHAWDQLVNKNLAPALGIALHAAAGFVAGAVFPIFQMNLTNALTPGNFPLTIPAAAHLIVPALIGAFMMALYKSAVTSPNQVIKSLAATVSPDKVAIYSNEINDKIFQEVKVLNAPPPVKPAATPPSTTLPGGK